MQSTVHTVTTPASDPATPRWADIELPDTWADRIHLTHPTHWWQLFRRMRGRNRRIELPEGMPGRELIPLYLQQEFHNLPNGNYSKRFTRGYVTGFDRTMLGALTTGRQNVAKTLQHCKCVLDIGCGGGSTAREIKNAGVTEVWGLDPSPYLLKHAATDHPHIRFVQGLAEATGFADQRFDGIAACFLLHELPPRYLHRALKEFNRILVEGGTIAVCEPSPRQMRWSFRHLWQQYGWRGIYFGLLARRIHEPFVKAWHNTSTADTFERFGFTVVSDSEGMPLRHIVLRKQRHCKTVEAA